MVIIQELYLLILEINMVYDIKCDVLDYFKNQIWNQHIRIINTSSRYCSSCYKNLYYVFIWPDRCCFGMFGIKLRIKMYLTHLVPVPTTDLYVYVGTWLFVALTALSDDVCYSHFKYNVTDDKILSCYYMNNILCYIFKNIIIILLLLLLLLLLYNLL